MKRIQFTSGLGVMFTPAENILDDLSFKAAFVDPRVAEYTKHHLFFKRFELFFREK